MDESKVTEWLDLYQEREMYRLGLNEWRIATRIGKPEHPFVGACVYTQNTRQRADVVIDPFEILDDNQLQQTFQHELMHCVIAPFDSLRDVAIALAPKSAHEAISMAWDDACELTVRNMEKMLRYANEVAVDEYEQEIAESGDSAESVDTRKRDKKRKRR